MTFESFRANARSASVSGVALVFGALVPLLAVAANETAVQPSTARPAQTGKLKWWHQLLAPDDRDWDTAVVAAFNTTDGSKLAAAAGKDGVLHVVDRTSGKLRFKAPLVERYSGTSGVVPAGEGIRICPIAAVQWNGPSYSPETNLIYMNGIDWCAQGIKGPLPEYRTGQEYLGWANYYGDRDPKEQAFGIVNAIDAATGQTKWRLKTPASPLSAITSTAGGVVITGETSGDLDVINASTGSLLLRTNIGGAIGGGVITYEAGDKQFIAAAAGNNSPIYQTKGDNRVVILGLL
jgi:alcohol dehydrogenase (cytochrome c)